MYALFRIYPDVGASYSGLRQDERLRHPAAQRRQQLAEFRQPRYEGAAPLRGVCRSRMHHRENRGQLPN